ncbi:thiolase family protein [Nocardia sp. CA-119907]|uniref:thiolase family protein n=1 Tax=Nocardia sp. CA-119907 TaxID=3239973 RepID=UPI003D9816E2
MTASDKLPQKFMAKMLAVRDRGRGLGAGADQNPSSGEVFGRILYSFSTGEKMANARIIGAATTSFGRFTDSTIRSLAEQAVSDALADAGVSPDEIESVFFANGVAGLLTGQEMIRGQSALRNTGLLGQPLVNVENACASGSTAFQLAAAAVESGSVDIAIAVGAEKLSHPEKARSFAAIGTAMDLLQPDDFRRAGIELGPDLDSGDRRSSPFMDVYAANTRRFMSSGRISATDFANVAVKNREHAALNPKAQFREPLTRQQVLDSRMVSAPLTLLMCSPIGDGAAAVVVCSAEYVKRIGADSVTIRGYTLVSGIDRADGSLPAVTRAARASYEKAGIGPEDAQVIELHDAAAPAELIAYEELGLCEIGDAGKLLHSNQTRLGGKHVVNPSGGLLSKGHPIGATGLAQLAELTDQLRGRCGDRQVPNARVAIAENAGGFLGNDPAAASVVVLAT